MKSSTEIVGRLFARLASMYGMRFADMWRGVNLDEVKMSWGEGLSRYSVHQIKGALDSLSSNNPFPPTLPEFLKLCANVKTEPQPYQALPAPVLTDDEKRTHAEFRAKVIAASKKTGGYRDWAYKIIEKHRNGELVNPVALKNAEYAVRTDRGHA